MRVLVTGGAGYIGSHACQRLLADGHTVVALDSLHRGHRAPMDALRARHPDRFTFVHADLGDAPSVRTTVDTHDLDTVMHFGALAYVGESVEDPLWYYRNNISAAIAMLDALDTARDGRSVERFIFSSSCATYGDPPEGMIPVPEHCPQHPTSPYGRTKLHLEHILLDYARRRQDRGNPLALTMLRYFNVAGSDRTGLLGEDHTPETHLIPVAIQAAQGKRKSMSIFGTDYPTPDGTCLRDYIHVTDLVAAHMAALGYLERGGASDIFNCGYSSGYSVLEVIEAVKRAAGGPFPVKMGPRRPGDAEAIVADSAKIRATLGWTPKLADLDLIVQHALAWERTLPR